jgi:hypothetical protein
MTSDAMPSSIAPVDEDDALFEQPRVDVVRALTARALLDDHRNQVTQDGTSLRETAGRYATFWLQRDALGSLDQRSIVLVRTIPSTSAPTFGPAVR